jgi:dGTPase
MHDLGHPPFGHAGESALDECTRANGGFEHNRHGLRIVELLEYRYPDFPGLNLSFEVLQAQAMHSKRPDAAEVRPYLDGSRPLLEAQVVDAADSLAYNCHDVDDALTAGLVMPDDLNDVSLWQQTAAEIRQRYPGIRPEQFQPAVVRALINWQVTDLLEFTRQNLRKARIRNVEDVRSCAKPLVDLGPEVRALRAGLEAFLRERVYQHYRILRMAHKGQRMVRLLYEEFCKHPEELPDRQRERARQGAVEQAVCDYIAGMTDRFAQDEYLRLFQPHTLV